MHSVVCNRLKSHYMVLSVSKRLIIQVLNATVLLEMSIAIEIAINHFTTFIVK